MTRIATPQEIETWYILPAVRKAIVLEMTKKHKLKQKQAAEKLGVTEAAVSQYISGKRGYDVVFDKKTRNIIKKSAKRICEGANVISELNRICEYTTKHLVLCKIHKMHGAPKKCDICFRKVIED